MAQYRRERQYISCPWPNIRLDLELLYFYCVIDVCNTIPKRILKNPITMKTVLFSLISTSFWINYKDVMIYRIKCLTLYSQFYELYISQAFRGFTLQLKVQNFNLLRYKIRILCTFWLIWRFRWSQSSWSSLALYENHTELWQNEFRSQLACTVDQTYYWQNFEVYLIFRRL